MLIMYTRVKDKNKHHYDKRIKNLSILLKYSVSKRPKIISRVYKLVGFKATVFALSTLDRVKV